MTNLPHESIIDATLPVLQQGSDARVPLRLQLPPGVTDTSALALATTDKAVMSLRRSLRDAKEVYTFSTDNNTIEIAPNENTIYLYFTDTDTLTFPIDSASDMIYLYGTLFVEDTQAPDPRMNSRPCSGRNFRVQIRPSFTRPAPPTP